ASGRTPRLSGAEELRPRSTGGEHSGAVFASAKRSARRLVEPRTNTSPLFGEIALDLREAVLSQREVVIQCGLVFGSLKLTVPPGVRIVNETTPIFGDVDLKKTDSAVTVNAPTIRLRGSVMFSSVKVRTRTLGKRKLPWMR